LRQGFAVPTFFPSRGGHPCPGRQARAAITSGTIGIFALGCLVGAGIGLAFAPKSGEEFRSELGDRMRRKADELGVNQDLMNRSQMPVT
jgi:hypothetical protein